MVEHVDPYQHTLTSMVELYIVPEIKRRHAANEIASIPMPLSKMQIIFPGDGCAPSIRLNEEVRAGAIIRLERPTEIVIGKLIDYSEHTIERIVANDPGDADCGHFTAIMVNEAWSLSFDFRYNKATASLLVAVGREFIFTARYARDSVRSWSAFVENLFSALELAVKAFLWTTAWGVEFKHKMHHSKIRDTFSRYPIDLNNLTEQSNALEALAAERNLARYLHDGAVQPKWSEGERWMLAAEEMLVQASAQVDNGIWPAWPTPQA